MDQRQLISIRCPECGHIRGEACDGSQVRLMCRQDGIKFWGRVAGRRFICEGQEKKRSSVRGMSPPSLVG